MRSEQLHPAVHGFPWPVPRSHLRRAASCLSPDLQAEFILLITEALVGDPQGYLGTGIAIYGDSEHNSFPLPLFYSCGTRPDVGTMKRTCRQGGCCRLCRVSLSGEGRGEAEGVFFLRVLVRTEWSLASQWVCESLRGNCGSPEIV